MRLAQKGFALVILLLAIELVFLGRLLYSLDRATEVATRNERATAVVARANSLLKVFVDGAYTLTYYAITRDEAYSQKYDRSVQEVKANIEALYELLKDDPQSLKKLDSISKLALGASDEFSKAKKGLDEGELLNFTLFRKKMMPVLAKTMAETQSFVNQQEALAKSLDPDGAKRDRERIKFEIAFIGVPMNILLALFLMGFFTRNISRRLQLVESNTERFKSGEELAAPMWGNDEISSLDHVFHGMVKVLNAAKLKEQQATEVIKTSEQRLRTLIDSMPVSLITVNDAGAIESVNPQAEKMFGHTPSEFAKLNMSDLFDHTSSGAKESFVKDLFAKGMGRVVDCQARTRGGATIPVEVSFSEFESPEGKRFLAIILDVTERHEMERLKREFVAMVSHDLRTPLMTVHGSLSLLSDGALGEISDEAKTMVKRAEVQIERLRDLVSNLLDLARLESGRFSVNLEDALLMDIFQNSAESVSALASERNIKLDVKHTDLEVHADADRLVQVIVNFLSNAIKFSKEGSSVELLAVPKDQWVEVRVSDTGRGIPLEQQKKIFRRFEQVEDADSRKQKGTGLGLSICQSIIESHDGEIGVTSEPGKGSTFWFRVRAAEDSDS